MFRICLHPTEKHLAALKDRAFETLWSLRPLNMIKRQRTADAALVDLPWIPAEAKSPVVFRKRYWYPEFKHRRKGFFRNTFFGPSRAVSEYKNLLLLHDKGLTAVKPILFGEERRFRFLHRALLVTSFIVGTRSLPEFLRDQSFTTAPLSLRSRFAAALGRWTASLHRRGFQDNSFHDRNILVHFCASGWRFSKIDSPKGRGGLLPVGAGRPHLQDLQDLDKGLRLFFSRQERLRAFLAYLGRGEVDGEVRRWVTRLLDS